MDRCVRFSSNSAEVHAQLHKDPFQFQTRNMHRIYCTAKHLLWVDAYTHSYRECMFADIHNQENELCVFYKHIYCRSTDAIHRKLIFIYVRIVVVSFQRERANILFASLVEMLFVVSNAKMIRSRLKMMALKTEKVNRILNWHRTNFTFLCFHFRLFRA